MNSKASASPFGPTRWTLVLRSRGQTEESRAALSELCETYYQPIYQFLRREGHQEDTSRELAQEFFMRILQRGDVGSARPDRGRFRSYLLGALKHFLSDERDRERRLKRGGGATSESLDAPADFGGIEGDQGLQVEDPTANLPDAYFDRQWALAMMERSLNTIQLDFEQAGKSASFEILKPWLAGDTDRLSQAAAAAQLGWSETAVKVAVHRLRKRFRDVIRSEIAQTVADGTDIDAELRYLVEALAQG